MAAGEGFEPSHTESESAVLPLHNPATAKAIIPDLPKMSSAFFLIVLAISAGLWYTKNVKNIGISRLFPRIKAWRTKAFQLHPYSSLATKIDATKTQTLLNLL